MKIYRIPAKTKAIIFDIDGTLYNSAAYVHEQIDVQIRHWAKLNGWTDSEARKRMESFRKEWSRNNGGKKISLGNAFTHFGIDIETSIQWRNNLLDPEKFLPKDPELAATLEELSKDYRMVCLTNNPVQAAYKTLEAVGIEKLIPDIVGLDTCHMSKPALPMLEKAMELVGAKPEECVSIGDRYDIDLALPLSLGMGAILVTGSKELKDLPEILRTQATQ